MAYKQTAEQFRREIRRGQLEEVFAGRRIKLLAEGGAMELEEPGWLRRGELDAGALLGLARLSQTEQGIEVINQAGCAEQLLRFLGSQFVGSEEQLHASYALCNLTYRSRVCPSGGLLLGALGLLEEVESQKVADNLLYFLGNTMHDYPEAREQLVGEGLLVGRLNALLARFENPTIPLCEALSNCTLQMLSRAPPHPSFLKLRQQLLRFMRMAAAPETLVIIKQSTFSLSLLARMFPAEVAESVVNGGVFKRLGELYRQVGELAFVSFLLKLANDLLKELKGATFAADLLPLLAYFTAAHFQTPVKSVHTCHSLRIETYKLISLALEMEKLRAEELMESEMGRRMLAGFETEDDPEMRKELVFVFTPVYVNIASKNCRDTIERALLRTSELDRTNFELIGHIEQLKFLFRH